MTTINAIREDMSKRIEVLQSDINTRIEEMERCRAVLGRIDSGPATPISLNSPSVAGRPRW